MGKRVSYRLQAIIGRSAPVPEATPGLPVIMLTEDVWMIPLSTEVRNRHGIPFLPFDECNRDDLPTALRSLCSRLSQRRLSSKMERGSIRPQLPTTRSTTH